MSFFHRLSFELPSAEQEWVSLELFARGADGVLVEEADGAVRLIAYCPDPLPSQLAVSGESWASRDIRLLACERCEAQDWLAAYRAGVVPSEIGRRFVVDPREPDDAPSPAGDFAAGRILLRIPARRAFGTGSHPSTRLVLEWLEDLDLSRHRVLDLGSGSGILSMAALSLGAANAVAIDIDHVACFVAAETLKLNGRSVRLVAGGLSCLGEVEFDIALVNILPGSWLGESAELARVLVPDGTAILSGLPNVDVEEVSARLLGSGFNIAERRDQGEWAALRVVKGTA